MLAEQPEKADVPSKVSFAKYAAPETRFCPARVYEYPEVRTIVSQSIACAMAPSVRCCYVAGLSVFAPCVVYEVAIAAMCLIVLVYSCCAGRQVGH